MYLDCKVKILKAFDMTAESVHRQARAIGSDLARIEMESMKE